MAQLDFFSHGSPTPENATLPLRLARAGAPEMTVAENLARLDVDTVLLLDQAVERIFADGSSLYYYHGLSRANTPVGIPRSRAMA